MSYGNNAATPYKDQNVKKYRKRLYPSLLVFVTYLE